VRATSRRQDSADFAEKNISTTTAKFAKSLPRLCVKLLSSPQYFVMAIFTGLERNIFHSSRIIIVRKMAKTLIGQNAKIG
jgi:hypothetical protein